MIMKKWTTLVVLGIIAAGIVALIVVFALRNGSLLVTVEGRVPAKIVVAGDNFGTDRCKTFTSTGKIAISPLPYGPYEITIAFPERTMILTIFHQNNWQNEHIAVQILQDGQCTIELYIQEELIKKEHVDFTSGDIDLMLSWI